MSVDDRSELLNARKKLEEQIEELEAAEKKIKDNEDCFYETHRNIGVLEEQREKYSYDKEMVNLLDENLIAEIKESKTKSRNKLEAINDDLRYK